MAKKVQAIVKLQIPAGKATPAPPVGTARSGHAPLHGIIGQGRELPHNVRAVYDALRRVVLRM